LLSMRLVVEYARSDQKQKECCSRDPNETADPEPRLARLRRGENWDGLDGDIDGSDER